jgi:hypothetical protein
MNLRSHSLLADVYVILTPKRRKFSSLGVIKAVFHYVKFSAQSRIFFCLVISRVELIRKDKEKFRFARKIPSSGKRPLTTSASRLATSEVKGKCENFLGKIAHAWYFTKIWKGFCVYNVFFYFLFFYFIVCTKLSKLFFEIQYPGRGGVEAKRGRIAKNLDEFSKKLIPNFVLPLFEMKQVFYI